MRKPTTECFQIHQKCLRWFSLCFRGLCDQFGVACEGKRMFSQAKFGTVALKTIYLFGCLRRTLVVTKVLAGFFFSSESVSYPRGREDK